MPKDIVIGFRDIVQDLLVPELKAIKVELASFKEEVRNEFKHVYERFEQVDKRFEQVFTELKEMRQDMEELKIGQAEILAKLDLDRRVTKIEGVIERLAPKTQTAELLRDKDRKTYGKK